MTKSNKRSSKLGYSSKVPNAKIQIFDTGTGTPMGDDPPNTKWAPQIVQYYRLGLVVAQPQGQQTPPILNFRFFPGCGYRLIGNDGEFSTFISQAKSGQPSVTPFKVTERGPHFTIFKPGYVVIQLENHNWRFQAGHAAITIGTNHTPNGNPKASYFSLTHYDEQGNPTPGSAPDSSTGRNCRLLHFGMVPRLKNTSDPSQNVDRFNLYLDIDQGFGDLLPVILDPDIRNDGGSDPLHDI